MKTGWTLKEATDDLKSGAITGFVLEKTMEGWFLRLRFNPTLAVSDGYIIDARRKTPRPFATAATALGVAEQIGFSVSGLRSREHIRGVATDSDFFC
ncbi:hypothetical protein [Propionivibrio sp.]|uniref:hypothetical protein n=1 Tax=Propionivibrio sp. TaxID=2212460 RepID=UPI003BF2BCD8